MRVAITGGAGFLGALLARTLLDAGEAVVAGTTPPVDELVQHDLVDPPAGLVADARLAALVGPLADRLPDLGAVDAVFHLAGVVSGAAEADLDLGLATNVDGMRALLDACRAMPAAPVIVSLPMPALK